MLVLETIEVLTSGRSGKKCYADLRRQNRRVSWWARKQLRGTQFIAAPGRSYQLAFIDGDDFPDLERTIENVRNAAIARGYIEPPMELSTALLEKFSSQDFEQMDVWEMMLMHQPFIGRKKGSDVFGFHRDKDGTWRLACFEHDKPRYNRGTCFVFVEADS